MIDILYFVCGILIGLIVRKLVVVFCKRQWVNLTDEEIHECSKTPWTPTGLKEIRAIEAKLKEKNT